MSKTTITKVCCDVCKQDLLESNARTPIQVLFTTEQTEGRGCPTYLQKCVLDLCKSCIDNVLKGNYIWASGAQGYNTYYFRSKE